MTERLVLRRWRAEDLEPFAALCADPEVMEHFPRPLIREQSDDLAARADDLFDSKGYGLWALERRDTGEFIGFTGLAPMPPGIPGSGGVEIGWRLARAHWGRGFASEAARESLAFAFGERALLEVSSITAAINLRSRAVMERIGMTLTDEFEHPAIARGSRIRPHVRYLVRSPKPGQPGR